MSRPIHGKSTAALKFLREEPAALAVYWCYVARSNQDGVAWPSGAGLARDTGWDKATCLNGRALLVKFEALERVDKYVRPQWRGLKGKELSTKLNLDRSEYYRPTGLMTVDDKVYQLLYIGSYDENSIDENVDGVPRPPTTPSDVRSRPPELDLSSSELDLSKNSSPSGDPAPTTSKPKAKAPSRLYREPSEPSEEITPEAARIAQVASVSFDDFGGDAWSKPASRTDGLFDAVFEVFGITDAEKRLNSQAGKYVMLLAGTASGTDEWGANALPKDWAFTGNHLIQWSHWYQEMVLKNDPNMNMPSKPGVISGSIQGWWAKGRPLSSKDAAMGRTVQQPSKTVVEEVQLTEEERLERLRTINELRARYGGKR